MKSSASKTSSQTGRVITRYGANLIIENATGEHHRCTTRRHLDYAVCGDIVEWQSTPSGPGIVTMILPRRNELVRKSSGGLFRAIAANIDQVGVIAACIPHPEWAMVDRYLVAAEYITCQAFIALNKSDLQAHTTDLASFSEEYQRIGYVVMHISAKHALGIGTLEAQLKDKITVLVGQSGVGKSSLVKRLLPHQNIKIGALSTTRDIGKHTTSNTALYRLSGGGGLIDSPGVRGFEPPTAESHTILTRGYIEFNPYLGHCRFHNCTHTVEPGCALVKAAEAGKISLRRLQSYQRLARSLG